MTKDFSEIPESYWNYEENLESDELPNNSFTSKKLVNGINIEDLCDGKEVIFEVSKDEDNIFEDEEEEIDEIIFSDSKSMREKRGTPALNRSFEEIASEMTNVTEDGFVKKQIVTAGTGKIIPNFAYVTVHYNLYKRTCELPFDSTYLRNCPERFRLDQEEVILGLEYAIKSMKKNENSMFFIKWEVAFGALGCPDRIEEKCDIVADITVLDFVEVDPEVELTRSEISKVDFKKFLSQAKQFLCAGGEEFSRGYIKNATFKYKKALRILNNLRLANKEEETEMLTEKVKCLVNLAVCYNKMGKSEQACVACQEALSIDHNNIKANFHYGKACIALSNFSMAQRCLLKANELKPNDKDINRELKKLNDKKAIFEMNDKMFWMKAFKKEESKEEEKHKEKSIILETFGKTLRDSLEDSINEEKPHVISASFDEDEMKVCQRIAAEMKQKFQKHPHLGIF